MEKALEYFGVVTGLLYLLLEIKQHRAMWVVGFLTSLVYVFVFFVAKIYADMGLNFYYVLISLYGFWQWSRQKRTGEVVSGREKPAAAPEETIAAPSDTGNSGTSGDSGDSGKKAIADPILYRPLTWRLGATLGVVLAALYGALHFILSRYTDSPIPVGDAFTTAVGIVATWMLARRIIEHWILWIIVNCVSVYLYYLRELYPTMFLYLCYAVLAVVGLYNWKKKGIKTNDRTL